MVNEKVKACINLHAVLRNMEDLCELDTEAHDIIQGKNVAIRFSVRDVPAAILTFNGGECTMRKTESRNCNMNLFFNSPAHFNLMIEGKKNPIPTKGFGYIGFLKKDFTCLADRLSYYLKPTHELLQNKDYARINTILTAYTAFFAIPEIANYDPLGKLNASRITDGTISIEIDQGPAIHITARNGRLETAKGKASNAQAFMLFDSIETASGILNGTLDSYSCIGTGQLAIRGLVPMIDNLNKILAQVAGYLR